MNAKTQGFQNRLESARQFIRSYWEDNHFSPSIREIATHLHISTSVVNYYIDALVESGWLEERHTSPGRGTGKARNIVPSEIFAGRPVFPDYIQSVDVGLGEDQSVEVLIEKMTDGSVAIVKAKKLNPKELAVKSGQFYKTNRAVEHGERIPLEKLP